MKPVHQTKFGDDGNCMRAAFASIFELGLEDVPDFTELGWWLQLIRWVEPMGLFPVIMGHGQWLPRGTVMKASGKSPRGLDHAVVWMNGKMVHDPHPSGDGIAEPPEEYLFFVVKDPAKHYKKT